MDNKERVVAYIDGFNLYFGMKQSNWSKYYWLNVEKLVQSLLKQNQILVGIKYFTSRVSDNNSKTQRQNEYLEALETVDSIKIFYGKFQSYQETCRKCGNQYSLKNEKMTDVNIAVEMLSDAFLNAFDAAMLISGDSDLIPPMNTIHKLFTTKRVFIAFPPNRHNQSVSNVAKGSFTIGRKTLQDSQFPNELTNKYGHILRRPTSWN
jgi:uncharacterized LabA/DUF88 family protein